MIEEVEERDVATVDIPGAFMQRNMEGEDEYMKLEGKMVDILKKLDPKLCTKFIRTENGRLVMYVKFKKEIYGTLQGALLFWKNIRKTLIEWGFEVNQYYWWGTKKS